jgi:hypothetical protein
VDHEGGFFTDDNDQDHEDSPHSSEVAQVALGLDFNQARELFRAGNTIKDVRRIAEDIVGGAL